MANIKQAVKLGVFTLAIMNVTAVVSLRGLPAEAVYGMSSAFYYLICSHCFSDSDVTRRRGIGCHVSRQARWCVPLGRRSLRKKTGLPCHLGTMD